MDRQMKKSIALLLLVVMVLCLSAGCGAQPATQPGVTDTPQAAETAASGAAVANPQEQTPEPGPVAAEETEPDTIEVTDMQGRTVTIPADVRRVAVAFNLEEYFAVAGDAGIDKLAGYSHAYWEGRREDAWGAFTAKYPQLKEIPDIGYNDGINVEEIISLAPDVVIMSAPVNYSFMESSLDNLSAAGIAVVFIDYHTQTVETHGESTRILGKVLGQEERADEIARFYAEQMELIAQRLDTLPADAAKPKVYMEFSRGVSTYGNTWSERMWGALIRTCGGENIAAGMEGNSVEIAPEQIIAANPDLIVFTASPQTDIDDNVVLGYGADGALARERLAAYLDRQGWSGLNAVQNQNLGALYHDLSRHIFDFAGAQFLAKQIHPELFADVDPSGNLAAFFERYMPTELSGAWMVTLNQ